MQYPPFDFYCQDEDGESEEALARQEQLEQETFMPRFGLPKSPDIVTATTVLPSTPPVPDCGKQRPKLKSLQLIALAIIHHAERSPTVREILAWLRVHFQYFVDHPFGLTRMESRFRDFFLEYDPPIVPLGEDGQRVALPWDQHWFLHRRYALVVGHFSILFPGGPKVFPVMKLPTELRLHVYEYALSLPCKQLIKGDQWHWLCSDQLRKKKGFIHSYVDYKDYDDGWSGETFFQCPPIETILALLSVSRKVRQEALPIFYRLNTFKEGGDEVLFEPVIKELGAVRRGYLRSLVLDLEKLDLCRWDRPKATALMEAKWSTLTECEELESLTLRVSYRIARFPGLSEIPGLGVLSALRGIKKLKIHGPAEQKDIDRLKAYLEPLVTHPREEKPESAHTTVMPTFIPTAPMQTNNSAPQQPASALNLEKRVVESIWGPGGSDEDPEGAGSDEPPPKRQKTADPTSE